MQKILSLPILQKSRKRQAGENAEGARRPVSQRTKRETCQSNDPVWTEGGREGMKQGRRLGLCDSAGRRRAHRAPGCDHVLPLEEREGITPKAAQGAASAWLQTQGRLSGVRDSLKLSIPAQRATLKP